MELALTLLTVSLMMQCAIQLRGNKCGIYWRRRYLP